ncbi:hypothetical protein BDN72DRAFT_966413 [Pluteus cervinus]|uniref:Uncharacterized protein n=1 Tax=Pluteus cervinus TaxID=181527 RepID=A0ACD2ZXJ8_9AGAR|nr:hypothetical protein BDN72DRAFT_966413 [Pluteus cervinus]
MRLQQPPEDQIVIKDPLTTNDKQKKKRKANPSVDGAMVVDVEAENGEHPRKKKKAQGTAENISGRPQRPAGNAVTLVSDSDSSGTHHQSTSKTKTAAAKVTKPASGGEVMPKKRGPQTDKDSGAQGAPPRKKKKKNSDSTPVVRGEDASDNEPTQAPRPAPRPKKKKEIPVIIQEDSDKDDATPAASMPPRLRQVRQESARPLSRSPTPPPAPSIDDLVLPKNFKWTPGKRLCYEEWAKTAVDRADLSVFQSYFTSMSTTNKKKYSEGAKNRSTPPTPDPIFALFSLSQQSPYPIGFCFKL